MVVEAGVVVVGVAVVVVVGARVDVVGERLGLGCGGLLLQTEGRHGASVLRAQPDRAL